MSLAEELPRLRVGPQARARQLVQLVHFQFQNVESNTLVKLLN